MYWQENDTQQTIDNGDVIDIVFRLQGKTLPLDHAYSLLNAIIAVAPWIAEDKNIGVSLILSAEEGNGWYRDENPEQILYIPRRTRLVLRIPKQHSEIAKSLVGSSLNLDGHTLTLLKVEEISMSRITTLYARHVAIDADNEDAFLQQVIAELTARNIRCKKFLCGKSRYIKTPVSSMQTRSLMLAELSPEDAIKLQQTGLGPHRHLGCGVFVPHKSIS